MPVISRSMHPSIQVIGSMEPALWLRICRGGIIDVMITWSIAFFFLPFPWRVSRAGTHFSRWWDVSRDRKRFQITVFLYRRTTRISMDSIDGMVDLDGFLDSLRGVLKYRFPRRTCWKARLHDATQIVMVVMEKIAVGFDPKMKFVGHANMNKRARTCICLWRHA